MATPLTTHSDCAAHPPRAEQLTQTLAGIARRVSRARTSSFRAISIAQAPAAFRRAGSSSPSARCTGSELERKEIIGSLTALAALFDEEAGGGVQAFA